MSVYQVMEELKGLMAAYREEVGQAPEILGLALSARKNLCIHPEVSNYTGMGCRMFGNRTGDRFIASYPVLS